MKEVYRRYRAAVEAAHRTYNSAMERWPDEASYDEFREYECEAYIRLTLAEALAREEYRREAERTNSCNCT
ncbi:MAG: hypothetical protein KGJ13_09060 [Patescibacteria group bacterium]|nr:hypothetical protein [Patescibacteria group bacterium]